MARRTLQEIGRNTISAPSDVLEAERPGTPSSDLMGSFTLSTF